jgi:hypothetical protein
MKIFKATVWLLLAIMFCPPLSSAAQAQVNPWPWEKELPFPWDNIEGIWGGLHDDETMIFSFEIIENIFGDRQIKVKQINPETMEIINQGLGVETNNVLRAVMVGNGHKYRMSVRLIENEYCLDSNQYTVITIESMGRQSFIYHFTIEKLSNSPLTQTSFFNYKLDNFSTIDPLRPFCFF